MDPKHSIGPDRVDYKETPGDLTEVHAAIERENPEPTANVTPIPMWLTAVCGFAICWAGMYLGMFHGGFRSDIFNERLSSPSLLFPEATKATAGTGEVQLTLAQQGKGVYGQCAACHQANGKGLPNQFPPLAKSEWVGGSEKRLVAILLKGIAGPITVEGATFNGVMPAWEKSLSDKKIAAVASFVRSSFDNTAPEITEAKVAAARAEYAAKTDQWTEAQLLQIPADATLPDAAGAAPAAAPGGTAKPPGAAPAAAVAPAASAPGTPAAPAASTAPATATPAAASTAPNPGDIAKLLALGKSQFMICMPCHQPTGMGLPMVFPPLTKSEYVNGPAERFIAMVLKGNMGPMTVEGKPYNNIMPGQELVLTDDKIAAVTTYVRANFGNTAPPIMPDQVTATRKKFADRKTPWTEPELKAWKAE